MVVSWGADYWVGVRDNDVCTGGGPGRVGVVKVVGAGGGERGLMCVVVIWWVCGVIGVAAGVAASAALGTAVGSAM